MIKPVAFAQCWWPAEVVLTFVGFFLIPQNILEFAAARD